MSAPIHALLNRICGFPLSVTWAEVQLNKFAEAMHFDPAKKNPLLDPDICEKWVNGISNLHNVNYTYGGLYEYRGCLWRGSYLKTNQDFHLGIDINVPADTIIYCPVNFVIREIFIDKDQNGGWGQRIVVETDKGLVIFAHLILSNLLTNRTLPAGTPLGCVAQSKYNGGWFPHLHIQGLSDISLLGKIDGYGSNNDIGRCPSPLPFLL